MTGLDSIVKTIMDEAGAEAEDLRSKAHAEADAILEKARAEAAATERHIAATAQSSVADVHGARESALALQRRQRRLETKQTLLSETLEKALQSLYALPAGEYFSLCLGLAVRTAEAGEGELYFNEQDKARMPADFGKMLAAGLPEGKTVRVANGTRRIDGGFVLRYGDVEENCSFRALFDARSEEFGDAIRPILFPDG